MKITWLTLSLVALAASVTLYAACGQTITPGASCANTESCIQQCADSDCTPDCLMNLSSKATPFYDALENCFTPACATPTDGGIVVPPCATVGSPDCNACIAANCAQQLAACNAN